jgi:insertion element IS1 protein InsB
VKEMLLSSLSPRFCVFQANESHGKETGETAHVERWNCTLRQRIGRFVRKTLSFSKSISMHTICLDLFLHRYNLDRAILLD